MAYVMCNDWQPDGAGSDANELTYPHIMLQLRHVFLGRCFFRERPRQHELGFEHCITPLHAPIESRSHPAQHRVADLTLDVDDYLPGSGLIPAPVQVFGRKTQLHEEVAGQVLRFALKSTE
jgi:hypothetical protein